MPSFGFGTITSQGVGSNINLSGIVGELMAIERIPLDRLIAQKASFDAKISGLGAIKSTLSSFDTALSDLLSGTSILSNKATSSDASMISATGTSGAVAGNYSLEVSQLAKAQKLVAVGQADSTAAIGAGTTTTLTFQLGTIDDPGTTFDAGTGTYGAGTTFTNSADPSFDVVIDSSNNTLEGIRDAINAADQGVTATIVNDGDATNPYRLVLSSTDTGLEESIQISVAGGGDATVQGLLEHNPADGGTENLSQTVAAQNAEFTVDGIPITKSSNTVSDVIEGVTLGLSGVTTAPVTVSVSQDTDSAKASVQAFVDGYNNLLEEVNKQTASNIDGAVAGALASDSATRQILTVIRDQLNNMPTGITGDYNSLSSIGVAFERDGTLSLDESQLDAAIQADSDNVSELFSSADGYATRLDSVVTEMLQFNGSIDARTTAFEDRISGLEDRQLTMEGQLDRTEARLRARFTALDVLIASMTSTNGALGQQLDSLPGFVSSTGS